MFAGSLVLGVTLIGFAWWLHSNDTQGWPNETFETEIDNRYLSARRRARKRIHVIIGACGVLIVVAAFAGLGPIWVIAWMCVIVLLMTVVVLAGFDALRTHRYHVDKLPEIRREMLGEDDSPLS